MTYSPESEYGGPGGQEWLWESQQSTTPTEGLLRDSARRLVGRGADAAAAGGDRAIEMARVARERAEQLARDSRTQEIGRAALSGAIDAVGAGALVDGNAGNFRKGWAALRLVRKAATNPGGLAANAARGAARGARQEAMSQGMQAARDAIGGSRPQAIESGWASQPAGHTEPAPQSDQWWPSSGPAEQQDAWGHTPTSQPNGQPGLEGYDAWRSQQPSGSDTRYGQQASGGTTEGWWSDSSGTPQPGTGGTTESWWSDSSGTPQPGTGGNALGPSQPAMDNWGPPPGQHEAPPPSSTWR